MKFNITSGKVKVEVNLPEGFERVMWADVDMEDEVYIATKTVPGGPHEVYDKDKRLLLSRKGRVFGEPFEALLVKSKRK